MRFSENRIIALIALAVCVLVSVFALGGGALSRERGKALAVFNDGADKSANVRHSMDAYLDSAAECARLMAGESQIHAGESRLVTSVQDSADILADDAAGLDARYAAYAQLKSDVEKLYNGMYSAVSLEEFKNFKLAYDDFWGYDDMIGRDGYHKLAKNYNSLISGFPGSLVAGITGNGALNTFGG